MKRPPAPDYDSRNVRQQTEQQRFSVKTGCFDELGTRIVREEVGRRGNRRLPSRQHFLRDVIGRNPEEKRSNLDSLPVHIIVVGFD